MKGRKKCKQIGGIMRNNIMLRIMFCIIFSPLIFSGEQERDSKETIVTKDVNYLTDIAKELINTGTFLLNNISEKEEEEKEINIQKAIQKDDVEESEIQLFAVDEKTFEEELKVLQVETLEPTYIQKKTIKDAVESQIEFTKENIEEDIKEEIKNPISAYGPTGIFRFEFNDADIIAMAKTVYAEANGEPYEGQVAVAAVIINRYLSKSRYFDKSSILAIVSQKKQFAYKESISEKRYKAYIPAVMDALLGWDPTRKKFKQGALFFFSDKVKGREKSIREGMDTLRIGRHNFSPYYCYADEQAAKKK